MIPNIDLAFSVNIQTRKLEAITGNNITEFRDGMFTQAPFDESGGLASVNIKLYIAATNN